MKNITLEILTSPGCVQCKTFLEFWNETAIEWPNVIMREFSILTAEGQALVGKHMIFAAPGIIINDELFATGGFDKKELLQKLTTLSGASQQA